MNATVQCLKTVPEFCQALYNFQGNIGAIGGIDHNALSITAALRDLYKFVKLDEQHMSETSKTGLEFKKRPVHRVE